MIKLSDGSHYVPATDRCSGGRLNEDSVMSDVDFFTQEGKSLSDIVRGLVPLAFRLLCLAAFREDARCNVIANDKR